MKKVLAATLAMVMTMGTLTAQNTFRGIVKYTAASTGTVDMQIPAELSVLEIKVYDNKLMTGTNQQIGNKVAQTFDFGYFIDGLAANGIELESYSGDGKVMLREETSKERIDSLYIPDTDPDHFYYERTDETKDIMGFTAKKLIMHAYDENGDDHPTECWYTEEIGPEYCLLITPIKGFPLVFTQRDNEGHAITYTCVEIVKGKVKEAEMFLPSGYKEISAEEFSTILQELKDAQELLE